MERTRIKIQRRHRLYPLQEQTEGCYSPRQTLCMAVSGEHCFLGYQFQEAAIRAGSDGQHACYHLS